MNRVIVTIHASLDFKDEMLKAREVLEASGEIAVILPELTRYQHIRDELGDDETFNRIKTRLTRMNFANVEKCDCLFILNYDHRGYPNYVGGNSFLEMGLAFYLGKPIYLLNGIPEGMPYTEEIKALKPVVTSTFKGFCQLVLRES